jgi:hypothetical protein
MPLNLKSDFSPDEFARVLEGGDTCYHGDVVIDAVPASDLPLTQALANDWGANQGTFKSRGWVMGKNGHGRTKQLELEGFYGRVPRLQTLKAPGGEVEVWADSYYRMKLVDLLLAGASPPPARVPPKKKRPPRPRTQAELDGLARGRETMARRRAEAETAS